jgi:hypothetical protein
LISARYSAMRQAPSHWQCALRLARLILQAGV